MDSTIADCISVAYPILPATQGPDTEIEIAFFDDNQDPVIQNEAVLNTNNNDIEKDVMVVEDNNILFIKAISGILFMQQSLISCWVYSIFCLHFH
jgi:hypothetical protein